MACWTAERQRGQSEKAMTERKRRHALMALLTLVLLVSAGMMLRQHLEYRKIAADSAEAAQVAGLPERSTQPSAPVQTEPGVSPEPEEPPEPLPEEAAALADIDLEALQAVNEDVVGWIEIPGTGLSYPLMQGADNQYYLSHNWKKETSSGGSVFLESTSSRDLTDIHTIVYAHRMRNDTMFGTLKYYKDLDFWQEHPRIYVVTADGVYRYDIFAAQEASVTGIVYRLDIEESSLEEEFLRYCIEGSEIDTGITPEAGGRILTLSTCTGNDHANRWVVHAVLRYIWTAESTMTGSNIKGSTEP